MVAISDYKVKSLPTLGTLEVRVYLARRMRFRFWLGKKILFLGAWLLCCDLDISQCLRRPE